MLPLFMGSHRLQLKLSLLTQSLREHKEVVRLDNSYANYREISAKVLLMYGGKGPTSQGMQQLVAVFPQSASKVFPALGHFGLNEGNPQEVASAVSAYFKQ